MTAILSLEPIAPSVEHNAGIETDLQSELVKCLSAILDGDYMIRVEGSDVLSNSINALITSLRDRGSADLQRVVTLSVEANETAILAVELYSNLRAVEGDAQSIATAAEEMSATAKEIDTYGRNISDQATHAQSLAEQGTQTTGQAAAAMSDIVSSTKESIEGVDRLKGFSEQISSISEDIKKIADNTNLLAINAAIEAARAGDAGRGFAVVAEEVRRLSGLTKTATAQVADITSKLETEAENVLGAMTKSQQSVAAGDQSIQDVSKIVSDINDHVIEVSKSTSQISDALVEQQNAAQEVADGITQIAGNASQSVKGIDQITSAMDRVQEVITTQLETFDALNLPKKMIMLAQSDHVIWKKRLANMMAGRTGLYPDELADHHSCRLGKWYDLVTDAELKTNPAFRALIKPHELVHKHGIQAVKYYNAGQVDAALLEIDTVADASEEVLRLLRELAA